MDSENANRMKEPSILDDKKPENIMALDSETADKTEEASDLDASGDAKPEGSSGQEINPYSYLERDEFTTEKFKIEISHPKNFGVSQLKKRLYSLDLKPAKVKVIARDRVSFVNFRCEEDREKALEVLNGHVWQGKPMKVKRAKAAADPMLKKRKNEAEQDGPSAKSSKPDDSHLPVDERLNNTVTPWWQIPYEEQLKKKGEEMKNYIRKLGRMIEQSNSSMKKVLIEKRKINEGLCCQLDAVLQSPIQKNYRNKSEFTIGKSVDGNDKVVGFRVGQYRSGNLAVVEPEKCVNIPQGVINTAKMLQDFIQSSSSYAAYDPENKTGQWMTATVRTNSMQEIFVIVQFNPKSLTKEDLDAETQKFCTFFESEEGKEKIKSLNLIAFHLLFQSDRTDGPTPELKVIFETEPLHEQLDVLEPLKFRISPDAFFQVNTPAAECLYRTIAEMCNVGPSTTLLDVCCGTGTIGLSLAKNVSKVFGIEMCPNAVKDAKHNAQLNKIENVEFHCGKAEDLLPWLIKKCSGDDVVAVVDPPRAGLHNNVVIAIRKASYVRRLVYVSCKPSAVLNNLVDFTRTPSNRVKGDPFQVVRAVPVDLFPQTPHCELVLLLERV